MSRRGERGSILVELVVAVPLLVVCTMLIVQGIVLASGLGALEVAAKDAARAAADSCASLSPGQAAARAVPDFVHIRDVATSRSGDSYDATVVAGLRLSVIHLGAAEFEVSRSATMPRLTSCR